MHASELMHDVVLQYDMNYVRSKNAQKHKARTSLSPENELGKHKITPFFWCVLRKLSSVSILLDAQYHS